MRQDKGLTLIEVLGSIIILAIAIGTVAAVLQNSAKSSVNTSVTDRTVQITRTVMEEIKNNLDKNDIQLFGQVVNLQTLRTTAPPVSTSTVYYPDAADQKYSLQIRSETLDNPLVTLQGATHDLRDSFRRIVVICTHLQTGKTFDLEALVPY